MPRKKVVKEEETLPVVVEDDALTKDLAEADREEFARLLRSKMSLEQRVDLLIELANHTDTKRAPVALRAIEQINKITGVQEDRPTEASPLFVLPPNTAVAVKVFEPEE